MLIIMVYQIKKTAENTSEFFNKNYFYFGLVLITGSIAEDTRIRMVPAKLHQGSKEQELDISLDYCCCH